MPIPHRRIRGKLHYTSDKPDRKGVERGREYFTITVHGDGGRTLRAYTEIDDAPRFHRKIHPESNTRSSAATKHSGASVRLFLSVVSFNVPHSL